MFFPEEPVPVEVVRELAALLATNGLSEFTLESTDEENALRLSLGRETRVYAAAPIVAEAVPAVAPSTVAQASETTVTETVAQTPAAQSNTTQAVAAPCVGIYRAPKKPVQIGDSVRSGQVVAVVESLRIPNEVVAPADGKVLELPVVEGQGVEWGQTLLVLEPAS